MKVGLKKTARLHFLDNCRAIVFEIWAVTEFCGKKKGMEMERARGIKGEEANRR